MTETGTRSGLTRLHQYINTGIASIKRNAAPSNHSPSTDPTPSSSLMSTSSDEKSSYSSSSNAIFWNKVADYYYPQQQQQNQTTIDDQTNQKKLDMTRSYLTPQSRIMEFGCGTGDVALLHAPYVEHVYATDFSSQRTELAQEKARQQQKQQRHYQGSSSSNIDFECVDVETLHFEEDSYDVVLGHSILHLLPSVDSVLQNIHKSIKPGGYFITSTPCLAESQGSSMKYEILRYMTTPLSYLGISATLHLFTKEELVECIQAAGFIVEEEYHPKEKNSSSSSNSNKDNTNTNEQNELFIVAKKIQY